MDSTKQAPRPALHGLRSGMARAARGLAGCALVLGALAAQGTAQAQAQDSSSIVLRGKDGWLFPGWGSLTQVDRAGITESTRLIAEARNLLAARGVKLQVLLLPDKVRFYADKMPDGKAMSADVQGRYKQVLQALQGAGIPSFDDEAVLRTVRDSGKDVFYRTDQHWTQVAADATAEATARMVQGEVPQLAGRAGSGLALGDTVTERRYGDLAELFLTAEERKQVGREVYTVRRQAPAKGLLDDEPAPVHVTGHSMVQPYFGFPQKLSSLLDRPVSLNWKPGNVGQWTMLLEYLESPAFKAHKPQVLVWQMFEPTYSYGPNAAGQWDNASLMPSATWLERLRAALKG
ncbi:MULTISPECIES: alginate O-acetyltransferase AlgX-related protein [Delftia]|uniref:alginate O-acetyltransferase AlgX-related protein n=1 Tax=Delftia TaxID=80865 RepID=UPI00285F5B9A|nr:twin-arginine translocation pathway signal [Delftia lacustris]MDR6728837.1 alginate O-acetyltransferase complex protein AlgJ [Delftia lacustris]